MPRFNLIIDNFVSGEVSPLTEARIASSEFKDGVREVTNLVPDSHGPLMGRNGMEFIAEIELAIGAVSATIFELVYSDDQYYAVVYVPYAVYVYNAKTGAEIFTVETTITPEELHGQDGIKHLFRGTPTPQNTALVITSKTHPPALLEIDTDTDTVTLTDITFTAPPAEWADSGYPLACTFFQERSWWAGSDNKRNRLWSSKTSADIGDYWDLTSGSAADDAIVFDLAYHGTLRWLESGVNLLIGTDNAEFVAQATDNILQPGDMQVVRQSGFGSSEIETGMIGNEVVYITSDESSVRSMWYRWIEYGWLQREITFAAEHILYPRASFMTIAKNPNQALWVTLQDGTCVAAAFVRQEDMNPAVGWYRIQNDAFRIMCATCVEGDGRSEIWLALRGYTAEDGVWKMRIVRKKLRDYQDDSEVFLDNYMTLDYTNEPTDTPDFSSAAFFPNTQVDVVADGFHYPDVTVRSGGTIDLPNVHKVISAGHPYIQRVKTMPVIMKGDSTVGHQMKRWNKVFLRLINSYAPQVNGDRPPERHVETYDDVAEPLIDGFVQVTPVNTWNRDGVLTIEQDLPFRLLLTGIYGEFSAEQI